jgi:16S rRNA (uracil1498-N3)-methyltransferase
MSSLKRVLCQKLPEPHKPTPLPESEANHVTRVLRLRDGDLIEAMDGKGHAAVVTLRTRNGEPRLEFLDKSQTSPKISSPSVSTSAGMQIVPAVLEVAILKGEAMEWVVEKAVELGISSLVPVITAHTVVQVDKKGPEAFRERWQKIADQALKQCGRLERMDVQTPVELESLLTKTGTAPRLWCDEVERERAVPLLKWLESRRPQMAPGSTSGADLQSSTGPFLRILVGPEGGWSELERQLLIRSGVQSISLGPLVLRAETAAIYTLSVIAADFRTTAVSVDKNTQRMGTQ